MSCPSGRDHNATSYSTETYQKLSCNYVNGQVEIITLRAIALKPQPVTERGVKLRQ